MPPKRQASAASKSNVKRRGKKKVSNLIVSANQHRTKVNPKVKKKIAFRRALLLKKKLKPPNKKLRKKMTTWKMVATLLIQAMPKHWLLKENLICNGRNVEPFITWTLLKLKEAPK